MRIFPLVLVAILAVVCCLVCADGAKACDVVAASVLGVYQPQAIVAQPVAVVQPIAYYSQPQAIVQQVAAKPVVLKQRVVQPVRVQRQKIVRRERLIVK